MLKGMEFNGQRNNGIYLLRGREKSPFHPIKRDIKQIGNHVRLQKTERDPLEIGQPIGFKVMDDDAQMDIIEQLTDWLITKDWSILSFDDEPGRSYEAILQNGMDDFEKMATLREGTLEFVARATLGERKMLSIDSDADFYKITGQEPAPWTSKTLFQEDADKFVIQGAYGRNITLNYDFVEGDALEIDYDKRRVMLNDKDLAVAIALKTQWFELPVGNVKLEASHETELTYYERFH